MLSLRKNQITVALLLLTPCLSFADEVKGNQLFPVFIKLNKLRTLLIGGGNIGLEKLTAILNNSQQADVKLVAENVNLEIKELAKGVENLFSIDIGDYYRTFLEIRLRKNNQTKLLDFLKTCIQNKIVEADG